MSPRFSFALCLLVWPACAAPKTLEQAATLYQHTDYQASLRILQSVTPPDVAVYELTGKDYFMLGEYGRATQAFEKALALNPRCSDCELWLGRTYGRRAETGGWFSAMPNASKARQHFEKAVALDPHNAEALNDLFDYDLNAPEMLGGGIEKAESIARQIAQERPAESHFEFAQIAEHRKQLSEAESHLRKAMELAPRQVGRVLDLARFLAKLGRVKESDTYFAHADELAPGDPRVAYARAKTLIEQKRDPEQARSMLRRYLESDLTPDDPPKAAAEKLLRQAQGE